MQNINLNNTNITPAESLSFYCHNKWHHTYSSFSTVKKIVAFPANLVICIVGYGLSILEISLRMPIFLVSLAVYCIAKGINLCSGTNSADPVKNFVMKYGIKGFGYSVLAAIRFEVNIIVLPGKDTGLFTMNPQNQPLQPQYQPLQPQYQPLLINGAPNLTKAAECA